MAVGIGDYCPSWAVENEDKKMKNERKDKQRKEEEKAAEEIFRKVHLGFG